MGVEAGAAGYMLSSCTNMLAEHAVIYFEFPPGRGENFMAVFLHNREGIVR